MNEGSIVSRVHQLGGFESAGAARRALCATLVAIGERLEDEGRALLGRDLPWSLSLAFAHSEYAGQFDRDELFERVAQHECVEWAVAADHARLVCRVLGGTLRDETLERLRGELGSEIGSLFDAPDLVELEGRDTDVVGSTPSWMEDVTEYAEIEPTLDESRAYAT